MAYCKSVFTEISSNNTNSENEKWIVEFYFTEDYNKCALVCPCSYITTVRITSYKYTVKNFISSLVLSGMLYLKTWGEFT